MSHEAPCYGEDEGEGRLFSTFYILFFSDRFWVFLSPKEGDGNFEKVNVLESF